MEPKSTAEIIDIRSQLVLQTVEKLFSSDLYVNNNWTVVVH